MTLEEKCNYLKDTISYLYERKSAKETHISELLGIDLDFLLKKIEKWKFVKGSKKNLIPSIIKYLNSHKKTLVNDIKSDLSLEEIAKKYHITEIAVRNYIAYDSETNKLYNRVRKDKIKFEVTLINENSTIDLDVDDEEWRQIVGYPKYEVSNYGQVRKAETKEKMQFILDDDRGCCLVELVGENKRRKKLNVARLVAFAFIDGYSETNNTVNHIDSNIWNNKASNLEWVSIQENLAKRFSKAFYGNLAEGTRVDSTYNKFKYILVDEKYQFKTISAVARFLKVTETEVERYLSSYITGNHTFKIVY